MGDRNQKILRSAHRASRWSLGPAWARDRTAAVLWLAFVTLGLFACGCSSGGRVAAESIGLKDVNGVEHHPLAVEPDDPTRATVLIFIATECPIANGYAPEINRIVQAYAERDVRFYVVHADPAANQDDAKQHTHEYAFICPALMDPEQKLVQFTGVTVTPEVTVLDRRGAMKYRGRIDDQYTDFGKRRLAASRHDLREALDDILAGRSVRVKQTKATGCFISGANGAQR